MATLIEDRNGGVTYGVAFQLINEAALDYLNNREVALGGYISHITMFQPRDKSRLPMPVLLYVATPSNQHWIGDATADHIANQVRICKISMQTCKMGPSGTLFARPLQLVWKCILAE